MHTDITLLWHHLLLRLVAVIVIVKSGVFDAGRGVERKRKHFAITPTGRHVAVAEATRLRDLLLSAKGVGVLPEGPA